MPVNEGGVDGTSGIVTARGLFKQRAYEQVKRMILSGELDELPAESLLHTLGHRHPDLPVVSLEAEARS